MRPNSLLVDIPTGAVELREMGEGRVEVEFFEAGCDLRRGIWDQYRSYRDLNREWRWGEWQ